MWVPALQCRVCRLQLALPAQVGCNLYLSVSFVWSLSPQTLSAVMFLLVVSFAVVWVVAMVSGVKRTIQRRQEARRLKRHAALASSTPSAWPTAATPVSTSVKVEVSDDVVTVDSGADFDHPVSNDDDTTSQTSRVSSSGEPEAEMSIVNPLRRDVVGESGGLASGRASATEVVNANPALSLAPPAKGRHAAPGTTSVRFVASAGRKA